MRPTLLSLFAPSSPYYHLLLSIRRPYCSSPAKPKWNSNYNLVVTHPVLSLMESCSSMVELKQIQAQMVLRGLMSQRFPASRVIAFCALSDHGNMAHARLVFDGIHNPNTYIWNTMIRGYARSKIPNLGLSLLREMVHRADMDGRTFVFVLKSCEQLSDVLVGEQVHCLACKTRFDLELLVQNGLIHYYLKLGRLDSAREVFSRMTQRDVVSWTTMIDGYVRMDFPDEAMRLFYVMLSMSSQPNEVTMITVLSACCQIGILNLGRKVHEYIQSSEVNLSTNLLNALVDMYGKCGCVVSAREVFDGMEIKDVFSWTSILNVYAKCGYLDEAILVFYQMPERNVVSWSSMIAGYAQANRPKEALSLFQMMLAAHVEPIDATLVSVLSACAQTGSLDLGRWIYKQYVGEKRIKISTNMANAFIDMYAKCGSIPEAVKLFYEMRERDIVSWNTMILAYAVHGYSDEALNLFEQLKRDAIAPDDITFVGVLSACTHGGFVAEGRKTFEDLKLVYGVEPKAEHYACLIDLLGKVGLLADAYEILKSMPMEPDEAGWGSLLNACRTYGNVELGRHVGDKLLGLDPGDSGIYVLLANTYANGNKWDQVKNVRKMMRDRGVKKIPSCSSIEVEGRIHEFFVADTSHSLSEEIYRVLDMFYLQLQRDCYASNE